MFRWLKQIIPFRIADQLIFRWQQLRHVYSNILFRFKNPCTPFPSDYTLYESYLLDYKKFIADGASTTEEIWADVKPYLPSSAFILDWGCGPARITRHLRKVTQSEHIYGSDPNIETIIWNQQHIQNIHFDVQENCPPLPFKESYFDLVIGFSVLTHINSKDQKRWISELYRVLKPNGIVWITTHGKYFIQQLSKLQKEHIEIEGIYNTHYHQPGHRMMSTYHLPEKWRVVLEEYFEILEYYDGEKYPNKAGKQDLWILRKKEV